MGQLGLAYRGQFVHKHSQGLELGGAAIAWWAIVPKGVH